MTGRTMNPPPALRSAGRKPTPAPTPAAGPLMVTALPSISIVPSVTGRMP